MKHARIYQVIKDIRKHDKYMPVNPPPNQELEHPNVIASVHAPFCPIPLSYHRGNHYSDLCVYHFLVFFKNKF